MAIKFTDKKITQLFESICNLVRHGYKISDACIEVGVSKCYLYQRMSKEEIDEIKNLKLDLTKRKKLLKKL